MLAGLWLVVAAATAAQDRSPANPQPTFRTGTQSVRVDLFPCRPLAPAFYAVEVTQGGVSRIGAFRVVP